MRGYSVLLAPVAQRLPEFVRRRFPAEQAAAADVPAEMAPVLLRDQDVRRRTPADVAACVRLAGVAKAGGMYRPASREWLDAEEVIDAWVVEQRHGEILGHVALARVDRDALSAMRWREVTGRPPEELAAVSRLFVRPRVRGQGIGGALLELAVTEARALGRTPVIEAVGGALGEMGLVEKRGWRLIALFRAPDRTALDVRYYLLP